MTRTTRYTLRFSDGRSAIALDMDGDPPALVIQGFRDRFGERLVEVIEHA